MSNPSTDIHHLAAAYALDAVDEFERHAFEAHYPSCDVCRADVADHRETLARVAAASPVAPSASVRDRVLAEISQTRQLSPLLPDGVTDLASRRRRSALVRLAITTAAAVVVAFVVGVALVDRGSSGFSEQIAAVVDQPDVSLTALDPAGSVTGSVRVLWSASTGRAIVVADDLDPAPLGQAYELWLITADGPTPMQLLDRASRREIRSSFALEEVPVAWGVTLEPDAGSAMPTGDILFFADA